MAELNKGRTVGNSNLIPIKKGERLNPNGRPVGSISALSRLKKEFREHPEKFDEYMARYIKNPANEKHVMEMLDGKPAQAITGKDGEALIQPILVKIINDKPKDDTNSEGTE